MKNADGVYELRERGSSRVWQFFPVTSDTVRIRLVGCGVLVLGACERWVMKTAFKPNGVEIPWNPFGRGYSFLNFRMDYHPTYETHYCEVEFHKSDGYTVYMDTGDARILWAIIAGDVDEFQNASRAAQKNRKGATPPQIA
jgi:hypothetical protein